MPKHSVLTITLNPAIDLTLTTDADRAELDADFFPATARRRAGGKGVNVARAVTALGVPTLAAAALGGPDAEVYSSLLANDQFEFARISAPGCTRTNVVVEFGPRGGARKRIATKSASRASMKFNQPGPKWTARDWVRAEKELIALMPGRAWVVLAGSLPHGAPVDCYARLARAARKAGARVAVDAGGAALMHAARGGADLLRCNRAELADAIGKKSGALRTDALTLAAALKLAAQSGGMVVVSHGNGPAIKTLPSGETWTGRVPAIKAGCAMGAGDAMLGGLIASLMRGVAPEVALREGMACGAAAAGGKKITRAGILRLMKKVKIAASTQAG